MWSSFSGSIEAQAAKLLHLAAAASTAQDTGTPGTAPASGGAQPESLMQGPFFMIMAFIAIMYFMMIRPNQKREKERRDMLAKLAKGDKVITTAGICGSVIGLTEKTVVLRVSEEPNVKMEFLRGAISQVVSSDNTEQK